LIVDNRMPANERVFFFGFDLMGITHIHLQLGVRNFVIRDYERTDKHVYTYNNTLCKKGIIKMAAVRHFKFIYKKFTVIRTALTNSKKTKGVIIMITARVIRCYHMFSDCFGAAMSLRPTIFSQICVHLLLFRNHAQSCCKSAYVTAMFSIYTRSCQHAFVTHRDIWTSRHVSGKFQCLQLAAADPLSTLF